MSKTQRSVIRLVVAAQVYVWLLMLSARGMQPELHFLEGDVLDAWSGEWAGSA